MTIEEKLAALGVHSSWNMHEYINQAGTILKRLHELDQYCPESNLKSVFKPFKMDLRDVRIVIVGQEPFTNYNQATGLPFVYKGDETPEMIQIIRKTFGKECYDSDVSEVMPDFERWFRDEGVLLLNASLTCEVGRSGSHVSLWRDFMSTVIRHISNNKTDVFFMLWGNDAIRLANGINSDNIILSANHPIAVNYGHTFRPRFDDVLRAYPALDLPF
jgi:uracil-DNA glycosylase